MSDRFTGQWRRTEYANLTALLVTGVERVKYIPRFDQEVILSYNKSQIVRNEDFHNNIRNQTIWCNKYIKFKGETLLFKN